MKVQRQEFDSRCDESEQHSRLLCLRVKNIEKSDNETLEEVLESIKKLFPANFLANDHFGSTKAS